MFSEIKKNTFELKQRQIKYNKSIQKDGMVKDVYAKCLEIRDELKQLVN